LIVLCNSVDTIFCEDVCDLVSLLHLMHRLSSDTLLESVDSNLLDL
jgi:hypothetical protein